MSKRKPKGLFTCGNITKVNGKWMTQLAGPATFKQKREPISKEAREILLDGESEKSLKTLREMFPHLNKENLPNDQNNPTTE